MKIKTMGASPLTGQIFQGTLNTKKGMWVGKKEDVTEQAVKAVAEHLMIKKQKYAYVVKDGKYLILSHQIVDELPAEFAGKA
ncbi:hypothetical protein G3755_001778 [Salmonella enterica]|uniref:Uncharacterized protein n=2 Tax=Salmonella enterica TaxID=28901 RepID=A0A5T2FP75_SALER|nr:hypothetical protein [Salmonella enterica]EAB5646390.1 hypothetical protein [Salmonella enterica subsp. enterica serovar Hvittingfoss]EAS5049529.1 hypothetical protein [Salmonella enterica subsp. enterica serovar Poona]EBH2749982.1 hypothetical protein [Salmonella enterica subsp. enterica]EBX1107748.1 hypothetical protein [Salmonella enterica subsp. enterica serovar Salford]EBY2750122.1 hypothetical protein [Salmonella enterica subsp. enterica serovar Kottbus]ECC3401248.1 hypothetical prot